MPYSDQLDQRPPFDRFLARASARALRSTFHPRYPFALDRGPLARELQIPDPANPFGHEPELAHLIDRHVPDDGVYLDVGANGGYFSVYLAVRPGFRGHIHAFEPVAGTFAVLRKYVSGLGCDGLVTCHQAAASDRIGEARMDVSNPNSGEAAIRETGATGEVVRTVTLDSLGLARVDFMKVDVEGHEEQALAGAKAIIERHRPFVFFESWLLPDRLDAALRPMQFLAGKGYNIYLPGWQQSDGSPFIGIGAQCQRQTLALYPIDDFRERRWFPGEAINLFAAPASREGETGTLNA